MKDNTKYYQGSLLSKINCPADLKLKIDQLDQFCAELRKYIIDIVSEKGGHFGASLGVAELTTALHYVFNTPTTSWFGTWVIKPMDIKFSPAEKSCFQQIELKMDYGFLKK